MHKVIKTLLSLLIGILLGLAVTAIAQTLYTLWFPQYGSITTTKLIVFVNETLTPNGTAFQWGECEPAQTYPYGWVKVLNNGTTTLKVYLYAVGLQSGWIVEWASNGTTLTSGQTTEAMLSLTIPPEATTWEPWDILIKGETP